MNRHGPKTEPCGAEQNEAGELEIKCRFQIGTRHIVGQI